MIQRNTNNVQKNKEPNIHLYAVRAELCDYLSLGHYGYSEAPWPNTTWGGKGFSGFLAPSAFVFLHEHRLSGKVVRDTHTHMAVLVQP